MRRLLVVLGTLSVLACPPMNGTPCETDTECPSDQRCRRGACGPLCLTDAECGDRQVCLENGTCGAPPQCTTAADCAAGFVCTGGQCACTDDSACSATQVCLAGVCATRPRCSSDLDCTDHDQRCDVASGVCLPVCQTAQDCAPTLDPRVAVLLYSCDMGTCTRRCTADLQCGGSGLICRYGLCTTADCDSIDDCLPGQFCTSATFGRCEAYTTCSDDSQCGANFTCSRFENDACPPGFDCSQTICRELPRCFVDADCVQGLPGMQTRTGYCESGHCQPSTECRTSASCSGDDCVGGLCVPHVCRNHAECGAGKFCVDGACSAEPTSFDLEQLRLAPAQLTLLEGETRQLQLTGSRLDGTGAPISSAVYAVDAGAVARVSASGVLTASSPGTATVRAQISGSGVRSNAIAVRVLPRLTSGRRALVLDASTGLPLSGAAVRACLDAACSAPVEATSDLDGVAPFPSLGSGPVTFTVVSPRLRDDGLPFYERVSVLSTSVADLAVPLRENPVQAKAGFSASLSFADVSSSGTYWLGVVATSTTDLPSLTPAGILGDAFVSEIPGLPQQVPLPGALVLYTSPGLGIPQQIKPKSLSFSQPGVRMTQAWAGRTLTESLLGVRSVDLLGYLGSFDSEQLREASFSVFPFVPDEADVDGDLLCASPSRCPTGSEEVPDYARFTALAFRPRRPQQLRTEVTLPPVPASFASVVVATGRVDRHAGFLPTGFASVTPSAPGPDGARQGGTVVVRSGAPYGGLEHTEAGVWALALNAAGDAMTARATHGAQAPPSVALPPFLPVAESAEFVVGTRSFFGGAQWRSISDAGAGLARVSLTGSQTRHVVYGSMQAFGTSVRWPLAPTTLGVDPALETTAALEVVTIALRPGLTVDSMFDSSDLTLGDWSDAASGYSRLDR